MSALRYPATDSVSEPGNSRLRAGEAGLRPGRLDERHLDPVCSERLALRARLLRAVEAHGCKPARACGRSEHPDQRVPRADLRAGWRKVLIGYDRQDAPPRRAAM